MSSIRKSKIEEHLLQVVSSHLESSGFRPIDLDFCQGGLSLLRIFIERIEDGQATIDDCATVSRSLDLVLESEITGAFNLEVSSPGLDRRLRLVEDFNRQLNQKVKLKLGGEGARSKSLTGLLEGASQDGVELTVNGDPQHVPLAQIVRAHVVWEPVQVGSKKS